VLLAQSIKTDAAVAREDSEFAVLGRQVAVGGQVLQLQGLSGVYSDVYLRYMANTRRTTRWWRLRRSRPSSAPEPSASSMSTPSGPVSPPLPARGGWSGCAALPRCHRRGAQSGRRGRVGADACGEFDSAP